MSSTDDNVDMIGLVGCYLDEVDRAVALLRSTFQRDDFLRAVHAKAIPREGTIGSDVTYSFHGVGCAVTRGEILIDFDFGPDSRHDGFDAWRLHLFAAGRADFAAFAELSEAKRALVVALEDGLIWSPNWNPAPHLLYLTDAAIALLRERRAARA